MEILDTTLSVLKKVLSDIDITTIAGIGITNQRETTVMWDKKTGQPSYNAIVWQCRRTTNRCKELEIYAPLIKEKTGLPLDPYFSATKIEWLLQNGHKLDKDNLLVGTIDTWLIWNLTNKKDHITDHSNASRTMLYNLQTHQFDDDLLALFNIPRHILPTIVDSCGSLATTNASITGTALPILSIIGDQQASLFCQCGTDTTTLKNTYGTGLFIMAPTGQSWPKTESLINTVAWSIKGKVNYALEGSIFIGGSAIQWLRDGLSLITDSSETAQLAQSLPDNEGVYFVPALTGLGTPYWDPTARGMIIGITRGTTRAHIARATLEALAYQTKDVIDIIMNLSPNTQFRSLLVDGGATVNPFLLQFQADILGIPLIKPSITETTAFGAALLAGITIGMWTETDRPRLNPTETTFSPSMDTETRIQLYTKWKNAVQRSLNWAS
jgi:glycerol kinase